MFIKIMTFHIVLSTPVKNPANSSNPVESGLVFERLNPVRIGLVPAKFTLIRFRSGSGQNS